MSTSEKIREFEEELRTTKYNKRTQGAIGLLKAKIARLKETQQLAAKKGPHTEGYAVSKSGDATVILIGFPSVGKSTLLNALTNAKSAVASYAFTTLSVIPGVLEYKSAKIQVLDVPGIVSGAARGTGRGKEVLGVMRAADLILMIIDVFHPEHRNALERELIESGIRMNQAKPDVRITKVAKGGIEVGLTAPLKEMSVEDVKNILREFRVSNAHVVIRESITPEQLIDVISGNRVYTPGIVVLNKIDVVSNEDLTQLKAIVHPDLCISADRKKNLEELKELIFTRLNLIRVYTKEVGKRPDYDEPIIMKHGSTVNEVCLKLHKDFVKKFRFARVWGGSAKFPGQKKGLTHEIADRDVVEIHVR